MREVLREGTVLAIPFLQRIERGGIGEDLRERALRCGDARECASHARARVYRAHTSISPVEALVEMML
jgi:hypothetical protein